MADYGVIREQIRTLVDPLFLKFREELMGSGVSFGRLAEGSLPTTTVVVGGGGGTSDPDSLGYIKGIKTYSGGILVGSNQKELSFINAGVTTAGNRTTITIPSGFSNPMTAQGDIIYGGVGGNPVRLARASDGMFLSLVSGVPAWVTASGFGTGLTDPTTTQGDILYRNSTQVTRRGIGSTGQVLTVSGGEPYWLPIPSGYRSPITTMGDLIRGNSLGVDERLPIGTEGYRLAVSGGTPQWSPLPPDVGFANPMTQPWDLIRGGVGGLPTRFAIGSGGTFLGVVDNQLVWTTPSGTGGGGGGVTDAEYVTTAPHAGLSAEVVIPGLAGSADIRNSPSTFAGILEEYDTSSSNLTWNTTPSFEDSDTTVKSHLCVRVSDTAGYLGTRSSSIGTGAYDVRTKLGLSNQPSAETYFGLTLNNSDDTKRVMANIKMLSNATTMECYYYNSGFNFLASVSLTYTNTIYVRITGDGANNAYFYVSTDGIGWNFVATTSSPSSLSISKVGYFIQTSASNANSLFYSDWLRSDV